MVWVWLCNVLKFIEREKKFIDNDHNDTKLHHGTTSHIKKVRRITSRLLIMKFSHEDTR